MQLSIGGSSQALRIEGHHLGAIQRLETPMRRYSEDEVVDFLVIGIGSAGGVLIQRLVPRLRFTALNPHIRPWVSPTTITYLVPTPGMRIVDIYAIFNQETPVALNWQLFPDIFNPFRLSVADQ